MPLHICQFTRSGCFTARGLCALAVVLGSDAIFAQTFPTKPVRIVTAETGGGNDFTARLVAQGISGSLGQQVIVENRGGAGGAIAAEYVAKSPADGYTLILYGSNFYTLPLLKAVSYDVVRDFAPITAVGSTPNILVVHPSLPVTSVKDLIALARAKPGELNYASGGAGGSNHLGGELFKALAGLKIVLIPYTGAAPALNAVVGGQVPMMFSTASAAEPHVRSKRLRALGVTSAQPSLLAPGMPTVAASLPGYEAVSIYVLLAPVKVPAAIISRLNQEVVRLLGTAEVKDKFLTAGVEVIANSPQQLAETLKSEMSRLGKVIKDAGIRIE